VWNWASRSYLTRRVRVFIFIRRGEFESSTSGEESSSLQLQERRVRVFNFIRRGEFESSTSGVESSSLQHHSLAGNCFFRCERGEAIGFAHPNRAAATSGECC
jgi:hypothetical protein